MTILLPLAFAWLQWNLLPGAIWVGYPSGVKVETVCVESVCSVPTNPVMDLFPWEGPVTSVRVLITSPDGMSTWIEAAPYPVFKG